MHSHLLELTDKHAKCIAPLLKYLTSTRNDTDIVTSWCPCMAEGTYTDRMNGVHAWLRAPSIGALSHAWTPFILSLAATSPVCALVHCADQMKSLLTMMITEECDVKKTPAHMILLQHYVPLLFNLIKNLGSYPHHLLAPILQRLFSQGNR